MSADALFSDLEEDGEQIEKNEASASPPVKNPSFWSPESFEQRQGWNLSGLLTPPPTKKAKVMVKDASTQTSPTKDEQKICSSCHQPMATCHLTKTRQRKINGEKITITKSFEFLCPKPYLDWE